ncbi:MAG: hypothetical protein KAS66_02360 [Candidatus Omnitrophica bacterium]|nr:hypothetical protein [Candidatus Omnitrophota bacterium]MCK5259672.1 hypothetical protein [Candidatus Omnitrophota bacterium]
MSKKTMERRDFLKRMGCLVLGVFLMPLTRFFQERKASQTGLPMREARHYTSGDNLAG